MVTTRFAVSPTRLAEHAVAMRRMALLLLVGSTLVAIAAPLVSLYLGFVVPVAIVAWIAAIPMWRRASRHADGSARVVTFQDATVRETVGGAHLHPLALPIMGVRAFNGHLEVVAGRLTPKVSVHQIDVPVTAEERDELVQRLRAEHHVRVTDAGPYGRHLAWAFTVVPAVLVAALLAYRVVALVLAFGIFEALSHLSPSSFALALVALVLVAIAILAVRWTRR